MATAAEALTQQQTQAFCVQLQSASSPAERQAIVSRMRETASAQANQLGAGLLPAAHFGQAIASEAALLSVCHGPAAN
ncbi:MAG TPA: hypothetical protein VHC91_26600 [Trinickia sp.]|uniref:hypothetical protein n=1 Tax=Trinickia sp. TaxID=2571163 RepID=UPI002C2F39A6|nr:hypothetical protein [Trinickia sp.]HVW53934.1 hypothetical protein [Trinickia sp.]